MKQFSAKRCIQVLASVLKQFGIEHIVLSPGSRNAPIVIHFSQEGFLCYSIVDERSAGFVALGMAKSLGKPVAISCTSGSAATNYYPSIVEAFYQNVPLLIITADRPVELVDQFDGQTIRQKGLYAQHSYGEFQLKEGASEDEYNFETVQKAVEQCLEKRGPVHINVPLSEPLYDFVEELPPMQEITPTPKNAGYQLPTRFTNKWNHSAKILILLGTLSPSPQLQSLLEQIGKNNSAVILTEANSNQFNARFFNHIDRYIFNFTEEDFKTYAPDLLITVGQNVVSKKIKQFLRKAKIHDHWHIDPYWQPDTYFHLTEKVEARHEEFFVQLIKKIKLEPREYYKLWDSLRQKMDKKHQQYIGLTHFSDFNVFKNLAEYIPERYRIHFSNSSAIRYAQLFDFSEKHQVYCNRGVSGIDGSTSTAMGFAMMEGEPTVLITGDLAFFYDVNGLWNQYIPPYTRIILINNGGGDIFRIIPGPSDADALDDFIATTHQMNASGLAKHFNFDYFVVEREDELQRVLENFFKPSAKPKILEVNTTNEDNAEVLKDYFKFLKI